MPTFDDEPEGTPLAEIKRHVQLTLAVSSPLAHVGKPVACPKCARVIAHETADGHELRLSADACVRWRTTLKCRGCGYVYRWRPNRA